MLIYPFPLCIMWDHSNSRMGSLNKALCIKVHVFKTAIWSTVPWYCLKCQHCCQDIFNDSTVMKMSR